MAVLKLSQIAAAGVAPAVTDQAVFVTGGATDNLVTVTQLAAGLPVFTSTARGSVPASGGVATTFLNGAGGFTTPSGTPGGVSPQVQFNNAGAFAGMSGTSWDDTNRSLTMTGATVTASHPIFDMTQTFNNGATTFSAWRLNVTNTASAADSRIFELQLAGAPLFRVTPSNANGVAAIEMIPGGSTIFAFQAGTLTSNQLDIWTPGGVVLTFLNGAQAGGGISLNIGGYQFTGSAASNPDAAFTRDAANIIAQRNLNTGTTAQTFRLYNTFTDSNNYERFTADWKTTANVCYVRNENAGTGSARLMVPVTGSTTFASLPSAATAGAGARSFITDATTTTFAAGPVGGGTNKVPVYSDGTNWFIG